MDASKTFKAISAVAVLVAVLYVSGYFVPTGLNWGFHFLGFLPFPFLILYLLSVPATILLARSGIFESQINRTAEFAERRPGIFLTLAGLVFAIAAFCFRIPASLLGDSFTLLKNFTDFHSGAEPLAPWHEPLSIWVLYAGITSIGSLRYPDVTLSFFIWQMIFGIGFLILTFFLVREIFVRPSERLLTFIFLSTLPYMLFFFGYIEVYAPAMFFLALYVLLAVFVLKGKISFAVLPVAYVLVTLSHYINGLIGISLLLVAWQKYKGKKIRELTLGVGLAVLLVVGIMSVVNFDLSLLINQSPVSHFLSITDNVSEVNQYSQPYTLLSPYHFLDIANLIVLMFPFGAVLLGIMVKDILRTSDQHPLVAFLVLAAIPVFLYLFFAKLEQGGANDWDAFAAQFFLLALLASVVFFHHFGKSGLRTFSLVVALSFVHSLVWFGINATQEPSLRRFVALSDKRNVSHLGHYTMALRLTRYYEAEQESLQVIEVWERYRKTWPNDPRGYRNELSTLEQLTPEDYAGRVALLEAYLALDSRNDSLSTKFTALCLQAGNHFFARARIDSAEFFCKKALSCDSTLAEAWNNLGSVAAERHEFEQAVLYYKKAIALNPEYADALFNLSTVYHDLGDRQLEREYLRRAAQAGSAETQEAVKQSNR